jgi:hypothetical protein
MAFLSMNTMPFIIGMMRPPFLPPWS